MSDPLLELPSVPTDQIGHGDTRIRYEDVAQDGRLSLGGVWSPIGRVLWTQMDIARAFERQGRKGVRNVLARVIVDTDEEAISVHGPAHSEVRYRLSHTVDDAGQVNRLLFETWLHTSAVRGTPGHPGAPPAADAPRVRVARAWGQHVFTRPAAPPGQHRVLELDDPVLPRVPPTRADWHAPAGVLELPAGAEWLDAAPRADAAPIVFGLVHTDGNQHVNFLAYPRLVEDAALRRFAELGERAPLLARRAEVGYRKPCFAGDRMRVVMQAFRRDDQRGVLAVLVPDGGPREAEGFDAWGKPHCYVRLWLRG